MKKRKDLSHIKVSAVLPVAALFLCLALVVALPTTALPPYPVISEVIVDVAGTEADSEMVELYNPTGAVVEIGGWDIAYKSATGSSWYAKATIPTGDTIPAFGHYTIGGPQITPTPDHIDSSLGFASSGGHIALRDASNNFIDMVGYGTANDPEGGDAAPAPGTDDSLERKPGESDPNRGNGQDSDNNLNDFTIRVAPEPQNSGSIAEIPLYDTGIIHIIRADFTIMSDTSNILLYDSDRNNISTEAEAVAVTVASTADPVGITLLLQEVDVDSGGLDAVTAGTPLGIALAASQQETGLIQVRAVGDSITVTYNDSAPYQNTTDIVSFTGLTQIKINEVMYDPTGADGGNEWVELYNAGDVAVDITGWTLTDEDAGTVMTMPSLTLPARNFVVWYVDASGADDTDFSDSVAHIYSGTATTVSLTNTEDQVALYASTTRDATTIIDFVAYCADGFYNSDEDDDNAVAAGIWPSDASVNSADYSEGSSLVIKPDGDDNNVIADWEEDETPTEGSSNSDVSAPSAPTNVQANGGDELVGLSWDAATPGDLPLKGYNIYRRNGGFYSDPINDTYITELEYQDTGVVNGTTYYYLIKTLDTADNESDSSSEVSATPSAPVPPGTNIVINEIMYDPDGDEPDEEWIELYNPTDTAADISLWTLTDGEGNYTIPDSTVIWADGFLVLGNTVGAAGGAVDLVYGDSTTGTLSLANTSDNVILKDTLAVNIDEVDYTSYWGGEAPNSLSRKYSGLDANDFTNWAKSQADNGTPRTENDCDTVAPTITHIPVTDALEGNDLGIHAEAEDDEEWYTAKEAWVYYRISGETEYIELTMNGLYDDYKGIIPGDSVTLAGIEYYIVIMDESNNSASVPATEPETNPYSVIVLEDTYDVVINEIMYDPPNNEPDKEWVELYNYDTTAIDLGGWILSDGEGEYVIPFGTTIAADSYLVLANDTLAADGKYDLLYGDSTSGQIVLSNLFGEPGADEVTLKLPGGTVIDEVVYNVMWGAANGLGPNNNSLEKLDSTGEPNSGDNWSYSMVKGGTPQAINSVHLIWDVWAEPTLINPEAGETSSIRFRLSEACTVTIKVYDDDDILVETLVSDSYYYAADTYYVEWDGKDDVSEIVEDICTFEIEVTNDNGQQCLSNCNDAQLTALNHEATPNTYRAWAGEFPVMHFYLSKPARATFRVTESTDTVQMLLDSVPLGQGMNHKWWDGRSDSGVLWDRETESNLTATDIEGHVIISRIPLEISTITTDPVAYFEPGDGDTQDISYYLNDTATVTVQIITQYGNYVDHLVTDEEQAPGMQSVTWDGRDEFNNQCDDGIYVFKIIATDDDETVIKFGDVCIYDF